MKRRIKTSVPEQQLHSITVSAENDPSIKWVREGHEFRYKGSMYDIVTMESNNDSITYHCINDLEETLLFAELEQKVQQRMDHQQGGGESTMVKKIIKAIGQTLVQQSIYQGSTPPVAAITHNSTHDTKLTAHYPEILTPPPQA
jgi:hypothetical protein